MRSGRQWCLPVLRDGRVASKCFSQRHSVFVSHRRLLTAVVGPKAPLTGRGILPYCNTPTWFEDQGFSVRMRRGGDGGANSAI